MNPRLSLLLCGLAVLLTGCDRGLSRTKIETKPTLRPGVTEAPVDLQLGSIPCGQTIYVPAYSSIPIGDAGHPFELAITLSVRNTDRTAPIFITLVRYYDQAGKLIHDYLAQPIQLAPMASTEFLVSENDLRGGISASFLVEWIAPGKRSDPIVEAVMLGTRSSQGISLTTSGRVIEDRSRPADDHANLESAKRSQ